MPAARPAFGARLQLPQPATQQQQQQQAPSSGFAFAQAPPRSAQPAPLQFGPPAVGALSAAALPFRPAPQVVHHAGGLRRSGSSRQLGAAVAPLAPGSALDPAGTPPSPGATLSLSAQAEAPKAAALAAVPAFTGGGGRATRGGRAGALARGGAAGGRGPGVVGVGDPREGKAAKKAAFVWRNPALSVPLTAQPPAQPQQWAAPPAEPGAGEDPRRPEALASRARRFARGDAAEGPPLADTPWAGPSREAPGTASPPQLQPSGSLVSFGGGGGGGGGDDEDDEALPGLGGGVIVGVCADMCPPAEREQRSKDGDLDRFERVDVGDRHRTSPSLAVKKFTRTNVRNPQLVRTPKALQQAMAHLLALLRAHGRQDFKGCYRFIWDRFRALRVDITQQALSDLTAADLYEKMARFHILAHYQLCEDAQSVSNPEGFNSHLNVEQLMKCLTSAFRIYDELAARGVEAPNEPELRVYNFLLSLDRHGKYAPDAVETMDQLRKLRPRVLRSPQVRLYLAVAAAYRASNWAAFFKLAQGGTHLQACILSLFFNRMRACALRVLNATSGAPGRRTSDALPLGPLAATLALGTAQQLARLAEHHGVSVAQRCEQGELCLLPRDAAFLLPDADFPPCREPLVARLEPKDLVSSVEGAPGAADGPGAAATAATAAAAAAAATLRREQAAASRERARLQSLASAQRQAEEQAGRAAAAAAAAQEATFRACEQAQAAAAAECVRLEKARRQAAARAAEDARLAGLRESEERAAAAAAETRRLQAAAHAAAAAEELQAQQQRARALAARLAAQAEEEAQRAAAAAAKEAKRKAKCRVALLAFHLARWRATASHLASQRRRDALSRAVAFPSWRPAGPHPPTQPPRQAAPPAPAGPHLPRSLDLPHILPPRLLAAAMRAAPHAQPPTRLVWKLVLRSGAVDHDSAAAAAAAFSPLAAATSAAVRGALSRGGVRSDLASQGVLSLYEAPAAEPPPPPSRGYAAPHHHHQPAPPTWVLVRDCDPRSARHVGATHGAAAALFVHVPVTAPAPAPAAAAADGAAETEAAAFAAFCAALPAGAALPLLVLVAPGCGSAPQAVAASLRVAELGQSRGAVGAARVICCDASSALVDALQEGVTWLASCSQPAPRVARTELSAAADAAIGAVASLLARASASASPPSPQACISACNAALNAAAALLRSSYDAAAASHACWPPPELLPRAGLPPPGWHAPGVGTSLANELLTALLPEWPPALAVTTQTDAALPLAAYLTLLDPDVSLRDAGARAVASVGAAGGTTWAAVLTPLFWRRSRMLAQRVAYLPPMEEFAHAGHAAALQALQRGPALPTPQPAKRKLTDAADEDGPAGARLRSDAGAPEPGGCAHVGQDVLMLVCPEELPIDAVAARWGEAHAAVRRERAAAASYDSWLAAAAAGMADGLQSVATSTPFGGVTQLPQEQQCSPALLAFQEARRKEAQQGNEMALVLRNALRG